MKTRNDMRASTPEDPVSTTVGPRVRPAVTLMVLLLLLGAPLGGLGQILQPAGVFGNNMVLQRSQHTMVWGSGGTNNMPLWLKYNGTTFQAKADANGIWWFDLDLTRQTFGPPDTLQISFSKRAKQPALELKNVAVGNVWVLAGWEKQGVPLAPSENLNRHPDRVRFLNLASGASAWAFYPQYVEAYKSSALPLRLAEALAQSEKYVGLVRITADELKAGVDSTPLLKLSMEDARPAHDAWQWASNDVRMAQVERYTALVEAKRRGMVTNSAPVTTYAPVSACAGESFSSSRGQLRGLTLKGAIYPSN